MSSDRHIFESRYTSGRPYIRVKVAIINTVTGRQTIIDKEFWIDTGFGGGVHVAEIHRSDANLAGVIPTLGTVGLAGGLSRQAYYCLAYIQKIGDCDLPAPGIETHLILQGSSNYGLLGLEILRHFIAEFDGPNQLFKVILSQLTTREEQPQS